MANKFHIKNKHKNGYDLELLSSKHIELKKHIIKKFDKFTIDFSNPVAVKELNRSLLMTHYGINFWEFPNENLCPPIPSRVDYIHYLADLAPNQNNCKVLDIGTGASLIYPILGVSEYNWQFVATDIDKASLVSAKQIIKENNLENNIELRFQNDNTHILQGIVNASDDFTFTMCNPPFYKNKEEALQANKCKNQNLNLKQKRNFAGNLNELCYTGGEKAFLHTYLYESSKYPKASKWFTSLVSKKENVKPLEDSAKKLGASVFKVIPMHQGNKITRIVCWRF